MSSRSDGPNLKYCRPFAHLRNKLYQENCIDQLTKKMRPNSCVHLTIYTLNIVDILDRVSKKQTKPGKHKMDQYNKNEVN